MWHSESNTAGAVSPQPQGMISTGAQQETWFRHVNTETRLHAQQEMVLPQTTPSTNISNACLPTIDLLGGSPRARFAADSRGGVAAAVVKSKRVHKTWSGFECGA